MSKLKIIHSGILQRSVVVQLLFFLMINDLPTINSGNKYLYAEDTAVKRKEQK